MAATTDFWTAPDVASARRKLRALHSELRNRGKNPIDAVREIAERLIASGPDGLADDSPALQFEPAGGPAVAIAFQSFLTEDLRGPFGQYLTPMPVAEHLVDLLGDVTAARSVMDPFLGSGLLLEAFARRSGGTRRYCGWEINPVVAEVAEAVATLTGQPIAIRVGDAFAAWADNRIGSADIVVANPPFGSHVALDKVPGLRQKLSDSPLNGRVRVPVELLAMELSMDRLTDGGLLSIILPYGVLTNGRYSDFRAGFFARHTLRHCTLLPDATFAPFRGVATSCALLIEKSVPAGMPYTFTHTPSASVGYDDTGRSTGDSDLREVVDALGRKEPNARVTTGGEVLHVTADDAGGAGPAFPLGEIAEVFRGKNPGRDEYVGDGPFLLKVGSLAGSFVSWKERDRSRVPQQWFDRNPSKHLRLGDICLTASAHKARYIGLKLDLLGQIPEEGAMASGEVVVIRLRQDCPFPPAALLQYLRSAEGYGQIQKLVKGSTAHLYPSDLAGMPIPDLRTRFDVDRVAMLHRMAEETFYHYLDLERRTAEATRVTADGT